MPFRNLRFWFSLIFLEENQKCHWLRFRLSLDIAKYPLRGNGTTHGSTWGLFIFHNLAQVPLPPWTLPWLPLLLRIFAFLWSPVPVSGAAMELNLSSSTPLFWAPWEDSLTSGPGDVDFFQASQQTYYISKNKLLLFCQGALGFLNCQIKLSEITEDFNHESSKTWRGQSDWLLSTNS